MAEIRNLAKLVAELRARAAKAAKDDGASVAVGYSTSYAVYVHERMGVKHPIGQAKFLEQPARQLSDDGTLGGIVREALRMGRTMAQGLLLAGLRLQRESQKLVPVDTGTLRSSAFTTLERGGR